MRGRIVAGLTFMIPAFFLMLGLAYAYVTVWSSVDWFAIAVAVVAFIGHWRFRWNVIPVVVGSAICGLVYTLVR